VRSRCKVSAARARAGAMVRVCSSRNPWTPAAVRGSFLPPDAPHYLAIRAECLRIAQYPFLLKFKSGRTCRAAGDIRRDRAPDRLSERLEIVPRTLTAFLPALADSHRPLTRILLKRCHTKQLNDLQSNNANT
jgi:hypothetical protein